VKQTIGFRIFNYLEKWNAQKNLNGNKFNSGILEDIWKAHRVASFRPFSCLNCCLVFFFYPGSGWPPFRFAPFHRVSPPIRSRGSTDSYLYSTKDTDNVPGEFDFLLFARVLVTVEIDLDQFYQNFVPGVNSEMGRLLNQDIFIGNDDRCLGTVVDG